MRAPIACAPALPRLKGEDCARALSKAGYHCVPLSARCVRMERGSTRVHITLGATLDETELRIVLVAARVSEQAFLALLEQVEAFVV